MLTKTGVRFPTRDGPGLVLTTVAWFRWPVLYETSNKTRAPEACSVKFGNIQ